MTLARHPSITLIRPAAACRPAAAGGKRASAFPIASLLLAALMAGGCASVSGKSDYDRTVSFAELRTFLWQETAQDSVGESGTADPFLNRRLRQAVERELLSRGFSEEDSGERVDFFVSAYAIGASASRAAGQVADYRSGPRYSFGIGIGYSYGPVYAPYGYSYRRCCRFGYPYYGYPVWGYPYLGFPYFAYPYFGLPLGFWYPWVGVTWSGAPVKGNLEGHLPGTLVVDVRDARSGELIWRGWADGALIFAPDPEKMPEFIDETIGKIMKAFPPDAS